MIALSYVIAGITLDNDFKLDDNTPTLKHVWCGISGLLLTLSSISNYGVALALSIEFFTSLRLTNPAARQNIWIKRINVILTFFIPILSVILSIMVLMASHDRIFETIDTGGICNVASHGSSRVALFVLRILPEYLPIYPSCVLSVLTLFPVAKKIFRSTRIRESITIPMSIIKQKSSDSSSTRVSRPTRAGPPPNSTGASNAKPVIPRNALVRIGLWCCLLIVLCSPMATMMMYYHIRYLIDGNQSYELNHLPNSDSFLSRNLNSLLMCLNMTLFLACFGTGEFANKQYQELWSKIFRILFCGRCERKSDHLPISFDIVIPPSYRSNSSNRVSPSVSYGSTPSSPPPVYGKFHKTTSYFVPSDVRRDSAASNMNTTVISLDPRYRRMPLKHSQSSHCYQHSLDDWPPVENSIANIEVDGLNNANWPLVEGPFVNSGQPVYDMENSYGDGDKRDTKHHDDNRCKENVTNNGEYDESRPLRDEKTLDTSDLTIAIPEKAKLPP
ncbi:13711_t:CDS:2 [Acaulospora morrowiae]|uniref:13711_t:CDS:1 n=1 Tax=Acaulospora morrowiae TaxID=94023 RepID=A0A9N8VUE6_9GLOM|nr:13711_t:CDS:2 [Acaulospora morrowiae]